MKEKVIDTFKTSVKSKHAASQADERAQLFDNCGPEAYCAFDIFEQK
jgi:hypothetical protein